MHHLRDLTVYTIGHSTRPEMEFLKLLSAFKIRHLVDVRKVQGSRKYPQFNAENLERSVPTVGTEYHSISELGGYRKAVPGSINQAWRNVSFRGFADYMQTDEFDNGINELLEIIKMGTTAIMCSEAVPWRCHRSLISDALVVRGVAVLDIYSLTRAEAHHLTPFAEVNGIRVHYPAVAISLFAHETPVH